eukprot:TRINITY_DN12131_c0_g1_i2.p2 TRINITY_DN12131_c0_g1~~TRINITY_DN12131_c0_g1_i2.p2  ORF type:complete len:121 (-),score=20.04 TRINITY_DN12131_c0_g1_i2:153-515(-)
MSSLPTLLAQMKELKSMAKDARRCGCDDRGSDSSPSSVTDWQCTSLHAVRESQGSSLREDPRSFRTSSPTVCAAGPGGQQRKPGCERKFSSEPPNPALSARQFFRARQERIASRNEPFVV